MERSTTVKEARELFGKNFIGKEELSVISDKVGIQIPVTEPVIPYDITELSLKKTEYLLVLGTAQWKTGDTVTLFTLRSNFGIDPDKKEPCFYNQDWYMHEAFMHTPLENKWYLIKKSVFENSRAQSADLLAQEYHFPAAIVCAYIFFINYFSTGEYLWKHDFIWCSDLDHNGDRIYVAKYFDVNGINKNGFSIHRHLRIREHYGAVEVI